MELLTLPHEHKFDSCNVYDSVSETDCQQLECPRRRL